MLNPVTGIASDKTTFEGITIESITSLFGSRQLIN